jgi:hypothetical protein
VKKITTMFLAIVMLCAIPSWAQDRLNAQPADGSPTLKATSDWLGTALAGYGGGCYNDDWKTVITDARIDNDCHFTYTSILMERAGRNKVSSRRTIYVPLGAVTEIHVGGRTVSGCDLAREKRIP